METSNAANKLELHYYFGDLSHSMDARIRNKCESEFLAIVSEISSQLAIKVHIDSEALAEGGVKEIWKFVGKNSGQIALILSILSLILSRIPITDQELEKLQKEELQLSIEEKRLNIEKLKREANSGQLPDKSLEEAVKILDKNYKVVTRRSNFYKCLGTYDKVKKIGLTPLDCHSKPIQKEAQIQRADFSRFVLKSNGLEPKTIENASIEIVSPVLKEGNYKWRGIYLGEPISFSMKDKDFKINVLNEKEVFRHGSTIECVLIINRKLDEIGDVIITGYSVDTVLSKTDGVTTNHTSQGKKYIYEKEQLAAQIELFNDPKHNN